MLREIYNIYNLMNVPCTKLHMNTTTNYTEKHEQMQVAH